MNNFIQSPLRNTWLEYDSMRVYVRKNLHLLNGKACRCIDIANVEVKEADRGNKIFTDWLSQAENVLPTSNFEAIYIENVVNPRLADFFRKRRYYEIPQYLSPSFYFIPPGLPESSAP